MPTSDKTLIDLEKKFWQAMVDEDTGAATALLTEPAVMVSTHGAMQFDHAAYRKMAEQGESVVTGFALDDVKVLHPNDTTAILTYQVTQQVAKRGEKKGTSQVMNDSSTWVLLAGAWKCAMHTEAPAQKH